MTAIPSTGTLFLLAIGSHGLFGKQNGQSPSLSDSALNTYIHAGKTQETTATQRSLFDGRWKLIEYLIFARPPITQLFDLIADPHESQDLSQDAVAAAKELPRLRARLAEAAKQT